MKLKLEVDFDTVEQMTDTLRSLNSNAVEADSLRMEAASLRMESNDTLERNNELKFRIAALELELRSPRMVNVLPSDASTASTDGLIRRVLATAGRNGYGYPNGQAHLNKINLIKLVREVTGYGLLESKNLVEESFEQGHDRKPTIGD